MEPRPMPLPELADRLRDLAASRGPAGPLLELADVWDSSTSANVLGDLAVGVGLVIADLAAQVEALPGPTGEVS